MAALADVLGKLRNKKQAAHRSTFSHYIATVRALADDREVDADECSHILESADRDETALKRDVGIQQQRNARAATLQANRQAVADQIVAQNAVADAQRKLQDAYDQLQPAIAAARQRLDDANLRHSCTQGADSHLAENILDKELLQREAIVNRQLREIQAELKPLLKDREFKQASLQNAEFRLAQMHSRKPGDWPGFGMINPNFWKNQSIDPEKQNVDDLQNQLRQLDAAINPRQAEQQRLQAELAEIHSEKLKP